MFDKYLVTGATGFLGLAVVRELVSRGETVRALVLEGDPCAALLPRGVDTVIGDVCVKDSLAAFFEGADSRICVLHCAGIISVASCPGTKMYQVNVGGTGKVVRMAVQYGVGRLVYVSSVHALPEQPKGTAITEAHMSSPTPVRGDYAKTKATATELVLEAAQNGLCASVVFPSGLIGPGDVLGGSFTSMVEAFLKGHLPIAVCGGYDFVDVRDVAKGIVDCAERGTSGRGYILSGQYMTIPEMLHTVGQAARLRRRPLCLPLWMARLAAPLYESYCLKRRLPLFFTPYSVDVLGSNGQFSHAAATADFGYTPRPIEESLRDMTVWIQEHKTDRRR